ncbi:MAG TPA: hypothetical protein VNJ04_08850 [Gemmatimonadaceae bacterium]|nr:hypothetical protein [Gemmatimonadaceae bacterium]
MRTTKGLSGMVAAVLVLVPVTLAGAQTGKGGQQNMAAVRSHVKTWPKASREAAEFMMKKYGPAAERTPTMLVWGRTGPWKRTVVYNYEVQHLFPGPHTDVMQQWVDYRVPPDKFDDLAIYDGSVVVNRTNGEISARCDLEAANFLALNLANEIVTGARTSEDARKKYGEQIMLFKGGKPAPYTAGLLFTPSTRGTTDPDRPLMK